MAKDPMRTRPLAAALVALALGATYLQESIRRVRASDHVGSAEAVLLAVFGVLMAGVVCYALAALRGRRPPRAFHIGMALLLAVAGALMAHSLWTSRSSRGLDLWTWRVIALLCAGIAVGSLIASWLAKGPQARRQDRNTPGATLTGGRRSETRSGNGTGENQI